MNIMFATALAVTSYLLVERRFLRYRTAPGSSKVPLASPAAL
jgi:hypothetical protein